MYYTVGMRRSYGASEPGETSRINQLRGQVDEVRISNPAPLPSPLQARGVEMFHCLGYAN